MGWVGWKDNNTVLYRSGEGVSPPLSLVNPIGGKREVILHAQNSGIVFDIPSCTKDFKLFVLVGNVPDVPGDFYYWRPGMNFKRLTDLNPWIAEKKPGRQEVIRYNARDGLEIEGLLISLVDCQNSVKYLLIVIVYGRQRFDQQTGNDGYSLRGTLRPFW